MRLLSILLILVLISPNLKSQSEPHPLRDFSEIKESKKIRIAVRERESVYASEGKTQFNHILAIKFAKAHDLELELVVIDDFSDYWRNENGDILKNEKYTPISFYSFDVAFDILSPFEWRRSKVDFIGFLPNGYTIVARKSTDIESLSDLKKLKGVTLKSSSYEDLLQFYNLTSQDYEYTSGDKLLDFVEQGKADYTVLNNAHYLLRDFPSLEGKKIIGSVEKTGWALRKDQSQLKDSLENFLDSLTNIGELDRLYQSQTGISLSAAENYYALLNGTAQIGEYPFVEYSVDDGLPHENINCIYQDKKGYMWFGTNNGLVKYNGRKFKVYKKKDGLPSNHINDIVQSSTGDMFVATFNGIARKDNAGFFTIFAGDDVQEVDCLGNTSLVVKTKNNIGRLIDNDTVWDVKSDIPIFDFEVINNEIFYSTNEGVFRISKSGECVKVSEKVITQLFKLKSEELICVTNEGVELIPTSNPSLDFNYVIKRIANIPAKCRVYQFNESSVWFVSNFSALQYHISSEQSIEFNSSFGLKNNPLLSFFQDKENNYWFGFDGGVQKLSNKNLRRINVEDFGCVTRISEDFLGNVYASTNDNLLLISEQIEELSRQKAYLKGALFSPYKKQIVAYNNRTLYILSPDDYSIQKRIHVDIGFSPKTLDVISSDRIILASNSENKIYVYSLSDASADEINIEIGEQFQFVEIEGEVFFIRKGNLVSLSGETYFSEKNKNLQILSAEYSKEKLFLGTPEGLFLGKTKGIELYDEGLKQFYITAIEKAHDGDFLWLGTSNGIIYYNVEDKEVVFTVNYKDGLLGFEVTDLHLSSSGLLWISTCNGLNTFDINKKNLEDNIPLCEINSIKVNGKLYDDLPRKLAYYENNITFELLALSFQDESSIVFDYYLEKNNERQFLANKNLDDINLINLTPGKYAFHYRVKGKDNVWSEYKVKEFNIRQAFYLTWWFILIVVTSASIFTQFYIRYSKLRLERRNKRLEGIVKERTKEINHQNEELRSTNELLLEQKEKIENQNKKINDSINYATYIQSAMLPAIDDIKSVFPNMFICFMPRDRVSGDFYWFSKVYDSNKNVKKAVFSAIDCTGHGVPGAFLSLVGDGLLNNIVNVQHITRPDLILNRLHQGVRSALKQENMDNLDGMDMSIIAYDFQTKVLEFAGAKNPLVCLQNGELTELKGDAYSIGGLQREKMRLFTKQQIKIDTPTHIYLFSDGYMDQFGGDEGKKYMGTRFYDFIQKNHNEDINKQSELFKSEIKNWMGTEYQQTDDILVVGLKLE